LGPRERDIAARISEFERQKLADLHNQRAEFEKRIADLTDQVEQLERERERNTADRTAALEAQAKEFAQKTAQLRDRYRKKTAEKVAAWKLKAEEREARVNELIEEVAKWKEQYESRGARPEDVAQIERLEAEVQEKSDIASKLFLELKHYQNELLNREAAYNKLFNARPAVGVLNVLERRVKVDNLSSELATRTLPRLGEGGDSSLELLPDAKKKRKVDFKAARSVTPRKI
jgi:uncharacterized small protein (DUF1192 family)